MFYCQSSLSNVRQASCNILDEGIANSKYTSIIERLAAYLLIGKIIIHHPKSNEYKIYTCSVVWSTHEPVVHLDLLL